MRNKITASQLIVLLFVMSLIFYIFPIQTIMGNMIEEENWFFVILSTLGIYMLYQLIFKVIQKFKRRR